MDPIIGKLIEINKNEMYNEMYAGYISQKTSGEVEIERVQFARMIW